MQEQNLQLEYYRLNSASYSSRHIHENDQHDQAFQFIRLLCADLNITSILDTGCGTGRGVNYFKKTFPNSRVMGNDISSDLLQIAADEYHLLEEDLVCCSSYELPFPDASFDIVTAFGILHHVAEPERVISEMLRVSRQAIFISDSNRFAQGIFISRLAKLLLYKSGLWWFSRWMVNGGKRWNYSEGDGLYYSYSVFDQLKLIESSCSLVFALPLTTVQKSAISPLLFSPYVLLCGFKNLCK